MIGQFHAETGRVGQAQFAVLRQLFAGEQRSEHRLDRAAIRAGRDIFAERRAGLAGDELIRKGPDPCGMTGTS